MSTSANALAHRVGQLERELGRLSPGGARAELDPERIAELVQAATDGELDRLAAAVDEDERARVLEEVAVRLAEGASGLDADAASPIAGAVAFEAFRRRLGVEDVSSLVEWLDHAELDKLARVLRVLRATGKEPRNDRACERALVRAARRVRLGLPKPHVLRQRACGRFGRPPGRWPSLACLRGVDSCTCLTRAVDLEAWERLGLAGVRAVARRLHERPARRRPSGAVRRRRARELATRRAAALVPAIEPFAIEPLDEEDDELALGSEAETAAVLDLSDEHAEPEPAEVDGPIVPPVTVTASGARVRRARVVSGSAAMSDAEAAALAARLGFVAPGEVVLRDTNGWLGRRAGGR